MTVTLPLPELVALSVGATLIVAAVTTLLTQSWHAAAHRRRTWLNHNVKPQLRWWECGGHLYPGVLEELQEHQDEGHHGLAWLLTTGAMRWRRHGKLIPIEEVARQVDIALAKAN